MLRAHPTSQDRVFGIGDVADGVDVGIAAAQPRRDQHAAVADVQAGRLGDLQIGDSARGDQHEVGVDPLPVVQTQPSGASVVDDDLLHADTGVQVDAVSAMQIGEHRTDLGAERTDQRLLGRFHDGHLGASFAGARGHLQPDPAAADDGDAHTVGDGLPQRDCVVVGAEMMDPAGVGSRQIQMA